MHHSKICFKCNADKPLNDFYKHKGMADGFLNKCKECTRIDVFNRRHSLESRDKVLAFERERAKRPERIKNALIQTAKWRKEDSRRSICHNKVYRAIKNGTLEVKPCCICGLEKSEAHHEDYDKPLDVVWYCSFHHKQRHLEIRRNNNERE